MTRAKIIDIIKASLDGFIRFDSKVGYKDAYTIDQLTDNQLITKAMFLQNAGEGSLDLDVYPAGSAVPYFVDISLYPIFNQNSEVITYGPVNGQLKRYYDIDVVNQDTNGDGTGTFTGWNVYGHTNNGSTTSEDLYIVLKP